MQLWLVNHSALVLSAPRANSYHSLGTISNAPILVTEDYSSEESKMKRQRIGRLDNRRLRGRSVDADTTNAGVTGATLLVGTAGLSYSGFCSS